MYCLLRIFPFSKPLFLITWDCLSWEDIIKQSVKFALLLFYFQFMIHHILNFQTVISLHFRLRNHWKISIGQNLVHSVLPKSRWTFLQHWDWIMWNIFKWTINICICDRLLSSQFNKYCFTWFVNEERTLLLAGYSYSYIYTHYSNCCQFLFVLQEETRSPCPFKRNLRIILHLNHFVSPWIHINIIFLHLVL